MKKGAHFLDLVFRVSRPDMVAHHKHTPIFPYLSGVCVNVDLRMDFRAACALQNF